MYGSRPPSHVLVSYSSMIVHLDVYDSHLFIPCFSFLLNAVPLTFLHYICSIYVFISLLSRFPYRFHRSPCFHIASIYTIYQTHMHCMLNTQCIFMFSVYQYMTFRIEITVWRTCTCGILITSNLQSDLSHHDPDRRPTKYVPKTSNPPASDWEELLTMCTG